MFATNSIISLSAEAASEQIVAETAETKPLVDILSSQKLYTKEKLAPAPRFGRQVNWKTSEDFIPPNDGKSCHVDQENVVLMVMS